MCYPWLMEYIKLAAFRHQHMCLFSMVGLHFLNSWIIFAMMVDTFNVYSLQEINKKSAIVLEYMSYISDLVDGAEEPEMY